MRSSICMSEASQLGKLARNQSKREKKGRLRISQIAAGQKSCIAQGQAKTKSKG